MGASRLAQVSAVLEAYARRGVFRSFSQTRAAGGVAEFRFTWLWNLPFRLRFDGKRGVLTFPGLLPHVPPASQLDTGLRAFIKLCQSSERPPHRRTDPARLVVRCSNRRGAFGLTIQISGSDYECGVKAAVNLVTEIFLSYLNVEHAEYMVEQLRVSDE